MKHLLVATADPDLIEFQQNKAYPHAGMEDHKSLESVRVVRISHVSLYLVTVRSSRHRVFERHYC